jgi:hypothetical protein
LDSLVVDADDPRALARWWADALGWVVAAETPDEVAVEPPPDGPGVPLVFGSVTEPKVVKNRLHSDLRSASTDHQAAQVARLLDMGARPAEIGQGDVPWVVLADPEGNELCVLDPRDEYANTGAVAAIVVDSADPATLAQFWTHATGWPLARSGDDWSSLRAPSGSGPYLEFIRVDDPKQTKNRVHLDLAPSLTEDHAAAVAHLQSLGATPADIGQHDVPWVVLADPEGNEFCVLTPR